MTAPISAPISISDQRRRIIIALGLACPSHAWTPYIGRGAQKPGCTRCPENSPFKADRASHPYVIEEEL